MGMGHMNADNEMFEKVDKLPSETWFEIARWARETNKLSAPQRDTADSLGTLVTRGTPFSDKQVIPGSQILDDACQQGFLERVNPKPPWYPYRV